MDPLELQAWINDGANPKVVMDYYGLSLIDYAKELERDDIIEYLKNQLMIEESIEIVKAFYRQKNAYRFVFITTSPQQSHRAGNS